MRYWAVQVASGKWISRGRFSSAWDACFELPHPELFDSLEAAQEAAKGADHPIAVPFEIVSPTDTPSGSVSK